MSCSCGLGEAREVLSGKAPQPGSSPVSLRRMTRSEIQRNPPESSEGACPIVTNRPRTTRIGTPAGSPPAPENSPDQPRPGGSRRGSAGLKRSAMVRGFAAPASARSITSRQDDVRNGSSPKYVPPGTCGRRMKRVTRVRFRKERATRQTPCSTTRRRVGKVARPQTANLHWHENCGTRADPIPIARNERILEMVGKSLGVDAMSAATAAGRRMALDDALDLALHYG
jgi:hypothetical protein